MAISGFDHAFELVEGGESMVITRHGQPVAVLMPYEDFKRIQDILGDEPPGPLGPWTVVLHPPRLRLRSRDRRWASRRRLVIWWFRPCTCPIATQWGDRAWDEECPRHGLKSKGAE